MKPTISGVFSTPGQSFSVPICPSKLSYGNQCNEEYGNAEGAFWPRGSGDNYVYNGGLQVVATIPSNAGFAWAGDTVGVFFMDPRGDQRQGESLTGIYNSANANDLAVWPTAAYATDTALFNAMLIGRPAISDQDTWSRYWDGDPTLSAGRRHMMGVVVDQRTLSWNRPFHQDIVYMLFRIINITSRLPASYAGLAAAGYATADQQQLAALGARFQDTAEARAGGLQFPESGYTFRGMYVAYNQDPDVGNASFNFSTAVLPFSLVAAMKSNYTEPTWMYPADVFAAPFVRAPGFEAIQFLQGAADSAGRTRIAVWSNTDKGDLNDPVGTGQLYRYLSGHPTASLGDGRCNSDPIVLHTCAALQAYADTRYFASTGPVDLPPGHALLVAVAMLYAAPVAQWAATTNGIYAMPAGQLSTYFGTDATTPGQTFVPGYPATPDTLALVGTAGGARVCTTNCTQAATIREPVERAMGWGQFGDANGDGRIEAGEVQTLPGSLLGKAQAAQALYDHKFVMPAAPAAPAFFLIPGDNAVTVAWQKSATDAACAGCGDPYFPVASDPTSPLFDPDYRQFDVVGYRIWRGTSPSNLQVVAEFDYPGLSFTDYDGQVYDGNYPNCAPEIGHKGAWCPVSFQYPCGGTGPSVSYPLGGSLVQIPLGGRIIDQAGGVVVLEADTVMVPWSFSPVPFVFSDPSVKNGFSYYYAVTALDINSVRSGPPSLESPLAPKAVTPRVGSGQATSGSISAPQLIGADGRVVPTAPMPTLDRNTGIFSGPMPPTDGFGIGLLTFLPQVLGADSLTLAIDSVVPADGWNGVPGTYYVRTHSPIGDDTTAIPFLVDFTTQEDSTGVTFPAVHATQALATAFGGDSTFVFLGQQFLRSPGAWDLTNWGRGSQNGYPSGNQGYNGPVWWDGTLANDTTADPWAGKCHPACAGGPFTGSSGVTAGTLTGAKVMHIEAYETVQSSPMRQLHALLAYVARAADMKVYWGANGAVDSVMDVTHHVPVPFNAKIRASWGILSDSSFVNTAAGATVDKNNYVLTWTDIACVDPAPAAYGGCTGTTPAYLMNHARLSPVAFMGSTSAGSAALPQTGNGFIFYIAGQFFVMQMAALPAAGTVWSLRTYAGSITNAPGNFYLNTFFATTRPPAVPGLRLRVTFQGSVFNPKVTNAAELANVHTVPDPYYNHSEYETVGGPRQIRFVNLPAQCVIRIYSASGILVRMLTHNDPTGGGEEAWNVGNRNGMLVASGVYFYHIQTPDGRTKVGRMTVVNMTAN